MKTHHSIGIVKAEWIQSILLLCIIVFCNACGNKEAASDKKSIDNEVQYAKMLNISYDDSYVIVDVLADNHKTIRKRYILVDKNSELPENLPEGTLLRTPLDNIIIYTDVYGGLLDELHSSSMIKGIADAEYFKTPYIVDGIKRGTIKNIGASASPSPEIITSLNSDGIVISIYDGMDIRGIEKLNVPIITMAENLEETPLGRAEWIKFWGLLSGKKQEADSIFNQVVADYKRLEKESGDLFMNRKRPKVMTETMYQGIWYVPAGKSYQANLLHDAGGDYIWKNRGNNGSLNLTFEEVLSSAADADIWLIRLYGQKLNKDELLKQDKRYSYFKPFKDGNVYYSDTSSSGLFETTSYHPERLLKDYVAIFSGSEDLKYFKRIE